MNRRDFSKTAGMVAAAAVVAPQLLAEPQKNPRKMVRLYRDADGKFQTEEIPNPNTDSYFEDKTTPAQREAIQRMQDNMPPSEIFTRVASEYPQLVPTATDKKGFQQGAVRIICTIGGHHAGDFYDGIEGVDLSDITYVAMYRQAVRNKYVSRWPTLFVATVPLDWAAETNPGQTIPATKRIKIGTSYTEIERMARESFAKLQEMVIEYHNREITVKAGDVVRFMGRGEKMTVSSIQDGQAWCQWFDDKEELNQRSFMLASLQSVAQE